MKRIITILAALLCGCIITFAQRPSLKFNADSTFKVVQFTDTHIRAFNLAEEKAVYDRMNHIIDVEKPDLVVMSGDVITARPAAPAWKKLADFLDSKKVPWFVVFGNHDHQQDLTRPEMSEIIVKGKYSLNTLNAAKELDDMELPVKSSKGKAIPFYVFGMDSHAYSTLPGDDGYDWFTAEQVQWLRDKCIARTDKDGKVAPSFAFFHIPLREYLEAWNSGGPRIGIMGENPCAGSLNPGMFAAMRETGSVMGTSVGHDHNNDFVAVYYGIALCYGQFSGSNTVYNDLPQGARLFKFKEGKRAFETWVREDGDRIAYHVLFDGQTLIKQKRDRVAPYGTWQDIQW